MIKILALQGTLAVIKSSLSFYWKDDTASLTSETSKTSTKLYLMPSDIQAKALSIIPASIWNLEPSLYLVLDFQSDTAAFK